MLLVTFSGLDGCGKTTHVARTAAFLRDRGHRVHVLESAHVSLGAAWGRTRRLFSGKKRSGRSSHAELRAKIAEPRRHARDLRLSSALKGWLIYPIDCLVLSVWIRALRLRGCTAVVCDRYVHDMIVNMHEPVCSLTRLLLWLAPRPQAAFFLDADPGTARQRRPENDSAYYTSRYEKYRRLSDAFPSLMSVASTTIEEVQRRLERVINDLSCLKSTKAPASANTGTQSSALGACAAHRLEAGATPEG